MIQLNPQSPPKALWKNEYIVSASDADFQSYAKLPALCNYFQESAWQHAHHLGAGYDNLKQQGFVWVLSKMMIRVMEYPVWRDKIILETWPKKADGIYAIRDFRILSEAGKLICGGTTAWLLLDFKTMRPLRAMEQLSNQFQCSPQMHGLDEKIPKLNSGEEFREIFRTRAGYSDLDPNGHVNNVRYISWACDCMDQIFYESCRYNELTINFLHETRIGEEIIIQRSKDIDRSTFVEGISGERQGPSFRCRLSWTSFKEL